MAISSYSTLRTELNNFTERSYTTDQVDTFCGLFESEANLILGPDYRRELTTTLTTDSSGEATLPSGFRGLRSFKRDLAGSKPLIPVSWPALKALNPHSTAGTPINCAISGSTIKVSLIAEDDFILDYWGALSGLSNAGNSTNWLILTAPNAYFFGVLAAAALKEENFGAADSYNSLAAGVISKAIGQSTVAQYGASEMVVTGPTP